MADDPNDPRGPRDSNGSDNGVEYDGDFGVDPVLIAMGYDVVQAFYGSAQNSKTLQLSTKTRRNRRTTSSSV